MAPNITGAKQTETTQRFKIHLLSSSGEDLFTKVEFSRRGFAGNVAVEPISDTILRAYKLPPLLVPHYDIRSAAMQKIHALGARRVIQARDIFDLYVLSSQYTDDGIGNIGCLDKSHLSKAYENVFEVNFGEFRDAVVSYLSVDDQITYNNPSSWEEVRLKAADFIKQFRKKYA